MKIRTQFNLALLSVFIPSCALSLWFVHETLIQNAKMEVLANAGLMMETAMSVRGYTIDEVRPQLAKQMVHEFYPQTVPAFAAIEVFDRLQKNYPDYSYREATLNPTNPRDKATEWEHLNVVHKFRTSDQTELQGERLGVDGKKFLYLARPIKITNPACLACHDDPKDAPAPLLEKYGDRNGFYWRLNEVVGAQIVTVPSDVPIKNAQRVVWLVSGLMLASMLLLLIVLNVILSRVVIRPIQQLSEQSDQISLGNLDIPEFDEKGADEIRRLRGSFNRMRRSVERAMSLLNVEDPRA